MTQEIHQRAAQKLIAFHREAEQRKRLAAEREASERRATFDRLASKGFIIPTGSRR